MLFLPVSFLHAADSLVQKITVRSSFITTDNLQNLYFINEQNDLVLYHVLTKDSIFFSNKQLGTPTYIDATNPLKIMVLYPDFNTIVWLDNTLSQIQSLKLSQLPDGKNYLATALCKGQEENTFWIFDALSYKLIELDERGITLKRSEAFTDIFYSPYTPTQLIFSDQKLYVNTSAKEILVFDVFANYEKTLSFHPEGFIQILQKKFYYINTELFYATDEIALQSKFSPLPVYDALQAELSKDFLFLRTENYLFIFKANAL